MKRTLRIEGMTCNHCVMHVTNALEEIKGVKNVKVSLEDKMATVELTNPVENEELISAVVETGYKVTKVEE